MSKSRPQIASAAGFSKPGTVPLADHSAAGGEVIPYTRPRVTNSWPVLDPPPSWAGRSVAERAEAIKAACRAAMQILEAAPDRAERLSRIDPVPASTVALLHKLAARNA